MAAPPTDSERITQIEVHIKELELKGKKANLAILALLKKIEWSGTHKHREGRMIKYWSCCLVCHAVKDIGGHRKDCELYELIKVLAEGE